MTTGRINQVSIPKQTAPEGLESFAEYAKEMNLLQGTFAARKHTKAEFNVSHGHATQKDYNLMPKHWKSNLFASTQLLKFHQEKHHWCDHQNSSDVQIQILKPHAEAQMLLEVLKEKNCMPFPTTSSSLRTRRGSRRKPPKQMDCSIVCKDSRRSHAS